MACKFDEKFVSNKIKESISVKELILKDETLLKTIIAVSEQIVNAYKSGNKVLFCGNGGSAADAQHLAAELTGKFYLNRPPLYAEALHVNTSYLTAVANDFSYDEVFSRLVKAKGQNGDILIGISTSGNSKNIIQAFITAKEIGIITVAMTGSSGGNMKNFADYLINVPSNDTPRIQEAHITIGHIICEIVERSLFGNE
jgi:D-sedoheptulose 7-phosphate isomerase